MLIQQQQQQIRTCVKLITRIRVCTLNPFKFRLMCKQHLKTNRQLHPINSSSFMIVWKNEFQENRKNPRLPLRDNTGAKFAANLRFLISNSNKINDHFNPVKTLKKSVVFFLGLYQEFCILLGLNSLKSRVAIKQMKNRIKENIHFWILHLLVRYRSFSRPFKIYCVQFISS